MATTEHALLFFACLALGVVLDLAARLIRRARHRRETP